MIYMIVMKVYLKGVVGGASLYNYMRVTSSLGAFQALFAG